MQITRRSALATGAAAITTAAITAPLAIKANSVKAALASDPVLPAYEAFETARREYLAMDDRIDAILEAVKAEMPPRPHVGKPHWELSDQERVERSAWDTPFGEHMRAKLGRDEDDLRDAYLDRLELAYEALTDIQATTAAGLLCQIRAWWIFHEDMRDTEVPKPDPERYDFDAEVIVRRLYHDVARLAGRMPT